MKILIARDGIDMVPGTGPIYIDDVYCEEGVSFAEAPAPKASVQRRHHEGGCTGNVSIKQSGQHI